jgi:hypothetical protein
MITVIVNFPTREGATLEDMETAFNSTAPKYDGLPGLVRKYYLFDEEAGIGGGVYLWETREQAEALYNGEWRQTITKKYGSAPDIRYFESPVIVDNSTQAT